MAGDFSNPSADTPDDQRYVHAVGPITLAAGAQTDVWIAIVAGTIGCSCCATPQRGGRRR